MKKLKSLILLAFTAMMLTGAAAVQAAEIPEQTTVPAGEIVSTNDAEIEPRADVIVAKFRYDPVTGKAQYRRWNETKGCWVDPKWIYVN